MRPYRIFNLLFLLPLLAVGCKDDDKGTVPSPIKDVRSEERPGGSPSSGPSPPTRVSTM